jgi:hypothetical protein
MEDEHMRFIILAAVCLFPLAALAQNEAEMREIKGLELTEAGLAKYAQATRNIRNLPVGDCDLTSRVMSISEMESKLDAAPGAAAAVKSAGMSTREYSVFALAVAHNSMAAYGAKQSGGAIPAGTSPSNVAFYQRHEGEIMKIAQLPQKGGCG